MPVPIWPVLLFATVTKVKNKIQGHNLKDGKTEQKKGTGTMAVSFEYNKQTTNNKR